MMNHRSLVLAGLIVLGNATTSPSATPQKYVLDVHVTYPSRSVPFIEQAEAWAIPIGRDYRIDIGYPRAVSTSPSQSRSVGLMALAEANPNATIVNGGFSIGTPTTPFGLLFVQQRILSPFDFSIGRVNGDEVYNLDTVLCLNYERNRGTRVTFRDTDEFKMHPETATAECGSAMQTGPRILKAGEKQLPSSEAINRTRRKRTVLGVDGSGMLYVVLFTRPMSVYFAGEFLRHARQQRDRGVDRVTISITGAAANPSLNDGLGLIEAVGLGYDDDSAAIVKDASRQTPLAGNIYRQIPSALIISEQLFSPGVQRR